MHCIVKQSKHKFIPLKSLKAAKYRNVHTQKRNDIFYFSKRSLLKYSIIEIVVNFLENRQLFDKTFNIRKKCYNSFLKLNFTKKSTHDHKYMGYRSFQFNLELIFVFCKK